MSLVGRYGKQSAWALADLLCFIIAATITGWLTMRVPSAAGVMALLIAWTVRIWFYVHSGMYRAVLRYSDINTLITLTVGVALGSIIATFAGFFAFLEDIGGLGRVFLALEGMIALILVGGSRFAVRYRHESQARAQGERVLILGAGRDGEAAHRLLTNSAAYQPVGFIDDNPAKHGDVIHGCRVYGSKDDLVNIAEKQRATTVVVAAELDPAVLRQLFATCMEHGLRIKVATDISALLEKGEQPRLEELALEDFLKRPARHLNAAPVQKLLSNKCVLVTGAGGSIGSDLARQVASFGAAQVVLVDHSEPSLYQIEQKLRNSGANVVPALCSLCDHDAVQAVFARYRPQVVFHAAAYKHVPLVELNPFAATVNNIIAMREVMMACGQHGCDDVVLISSDKAVRPTNVMGATKRVCEHILRGWPEGPQRRSAVRFGNVLGSSGSVVPLFLEQIGRGGPVTVTDPEVTRYFMLIPEAVELVLQAAAIATPGDIFLLDMGEPIRIDHLARQLIYMTGRVPEVDIPISYTGLRPGEKLMEELLLTGEEVETPVPGVMRARSEESSDNAIQAQVEALLAACAEHDTDAFKERLLALVPEWQADPQRWA